jgi:tetratricopeptide (TPR) repeat protein
LSRTKDRREAQNIVSCRRHFKARIAGFNFQKAAPGKICRSLDTRTRLKNGVANAPKKGRGVEVMTNLIGDLRDLIEHDQKSARPLLMDLVERLPKSVEARVLVATSYLRSLEPVPALQHFRAAAALAPSDLSIRHQMGLCAISAGDYETALTIFREALSLSPKEHATTMMALILHRLGRFDEALKAYSGLLANLKRDHGEAPHALRGAAFVLRDAGFPLAADRFLHELRVIYNFNPSRVAGLLVERDNSIDAHEWSRYATKSGLAELLARFAQAVPGVLAYPETFLLPQDRAALLAAAAGSPRAAWIAKPHRGTGGQGIVVSRDVHAFAERDDVVVQRYIERPYLVDGLKAHMRLYGLVTSASPFRAYLYGDGIVRFAPEAYDPSDAGLANPHSNVTNTARHHGHPKLKVSDDATKDNVGHIWSLRAYLDRSRAEGHDAARVWSDLRGLVKGFLSAVAADGLFMRLARSSPRRAFPPKLFGLDVLLDEDGKPWLIEVQRKPAMSGSPLIARVNGQMFASIFEMSCTPAFDDRLSAEQIAALAKDPKAMIARETELEGARKGLFELLT